MAGRPSLTHVGRKKVGSGGRFKWYQSQAEHEGHLRTVSQTLRERELYAKLSKCNFWLQEVDFLGHIVYKEGIRIDPKKAEAVVH